MILAERAKALLQTPKTEWPVIEGERDGIGYLFTHYVMPLAAIPPVAAYIGTSVMGFGGYRMGLLTGLYRAAVIYLLTLASVFLMAFVINALAGLFGGQKNSANAMKVSVYAPTAAWLAGIFDINPPLAFLSIMGLYSFYLLHTGLAALMKPAADKALAYTIAASASVIVLWALVLGIPAMLFGLSDAQIMR